MRRAAELGPKLGKKLGRKDITLFPDAQQVLELRLLIGRQAFQDVIKQSRNQLSHTLHRCIVCPWFASSLYVEVLSVALRGLYPLTNYAVNDI